MKKVLFLTRLFNPHIGGVETHVFRVSQELQQKGYQVTILTEQFEEALNEYQMLNGMEIYRIPFSFTQSKAQLWKWIWTYRKLFKEADIVHVHDVFWWIIPVLSIVRAKLFTTFHGWEGKFPPATAAQLQRRIAFQLSHGVMQVGDYIEKWYKTKPDVVTYGGVDLESAKPKHVKNVFKKVLNAAKQGTFVAVGKFPFEAVFVGRLSDDNDVKKVGEFFTLMQGQQAKAKFAFIGDGPFAGYCESIGKVTGFIPHVMEYMLDAKVVCANSYLSILQAQSLGKLVCSFYSNPLKKDYLSLYPQAHNMIIAESATEALEELTELQKHPQQLKSMIQEASEWSRKQSWEKVAEEYEGLWKKAP